MTDKKPAIVCVGEAMIELTRGPDGRLAQSCGGDVFNTAVYLARGGANAAFASVLGDDPYSDGIAALAGVEGVATDLILRTPGRLPGLAIVETDPRSARSVHFWNDTAPARDLFELPDWGVVAEGLVSAGMVYFSGITLSLYSNIGLGRFLATIEMARKGGTRIVFDGNFRPHGWRGDLGRARAVFIEALKRTDIALPTYDDEAVLWGDPSPEATVERMQAFGIGEVVVKNGPNSALVMAGGQREFVPVPEVVAPVDATAAGDSFNAGYLAARLKGDTVIPAAGAAHALASQVIRHRGGIMPRANAAMH